MFPRNFKIQVRNGEVHLPQRSVQTYKRSLALEKSTVRSKAEENGSPCIWVRRDAEAAAADGDDVAGARAADGRRR